MTSQRIRATKSEELIPLIFKRVEGHVDDVQALYELLRNRGSNISHTEMPSFEEHRKFVLKHPYRFWYIVKQPSAILGSIYFHYDNSIGINMPGKNSILIAATLKKALCMHKPLKGKKSIRSNAFFVNASPQDRKLKKALRDLGWSVLQVSYACPSYFAKEVTNV